MCEWLGIVKWLAIIEWGGGGGGGAMVRNDSMVLGMIKWGSCNYNIGEYARMIGGVG